MTTYLAGGWYSPEPQGGLRTEVLDGAMDMAGTLHRAGIAAELISMLALRVRSLVRLGEAGQSRWGDDERAIIARRLEPLTGDSPELVSFVADCLDHVSNAADLTSFYLHLMHINRMMQLLALAQRGPLGALLSASSSGSGPSSSPTSIAEPKSRGSGERKGTRARSATNAAATRGRAKAKPSHAGHARKPKRGIVTKRQPPKRHSTKARTKSKNRDKSSRASKRKG